MKWARVIYAGLLWFMLCAGQLAGQTVANTFDAANKLYEQGKFNEAAAAYEQVTNSGLVSTALYFNLGNSFFKAGQLGRAIAAYYQAERLDPRDSDLRANLQFARNQVQGPTLTPIKWQAWLARLTINEWAWLAAGGFWIWFALLTIGQLRPALRPGLRNYVWIFGLATGVLSACLGLAMHGRNSPPAIVITGDTIVRQAPIDEAQGAFTVHDGAELQIVDRKEDWLQVTTDPRRIGWLRRNQVIVP